VYLEAEDGELSGGMTALADAQTSGGHFIAAPLGSESETPPGPARARYQLEAESAGIYHVWGRLHGQDLDSNRCYFRIDGGSFHTWRITTGDAWYWDVLHDNFHYDVPYDFELSAGRHELELSSEVANFGVDRLFYSADGSKPAHRETLCNPPHFVELDGVCNPSCGSLAGNCGGDPCVGLPSMPTYDCAACCIPEP
jgi:hypothetical protein